MNTEYCSAKYIPIVILRWFVFSPLYLIECSLLSLYIESSVVNMINSAGTLTSVFLSPLRDSRCQNVINLLLLQEANTESSRVLTKNCWNPHIQPSLLEKMKMLSVCVVGTICKIHWLDQQQGDSEQPHCRLTAMIKLKSVSDQQMSAKFWLLILHFVRLRLISFH